jgi:hypothetical protein
VLSGASCVAEGEQFGEAGCELMGFDAVAAKVETVEDDPGHAVPDPRVALSSPVTGLRVAEQVVDAPTIVHGWRLSQSPA